MLLFLQLKQTDKLFDRRPPYRKCGFGRFLHFVHALFCEANSRFKFRLLCYRSVPLDPRRNSALEQLAVTFRLYLGHLELRLKCDHRIFFVELLGFKLGHLIPKFRLRGLKTPARILYLLFQHRIGQGKNDLSRGDALTSLNVDFINLAITRRGNPPFFFRYENAIAPNLANKLTALGGPDPEQTLDRKSTRLNSSH